LLGVWLSFTIGTIKDRRSSFCHIRELCLFIYEPISMPWKLHFVPSDTAVCLVGLESFICIVGLPGLPCSFMRSGASATKLEASCAVHRLNPAACQDSSTMRELLCTMFFGDARVVPLRMGCGGCEGFCLGKFEWWLEISTKLSLGKHVRAQIHLQSELCRACIIVWSLSHTKLDTSQRQSRSLR
jgi:hypothetical protein